MSALLVTEPRAECLTWLTAHVPPGTPVEIYQKPNLLPGLEAAGFVPHRTEDMTQAAFRSRAPEVVVLADNAHWQWSREQRAFVAWLTGGPEPYEVQRFGPHTVSPVTAASQRGYHEQIAPNITALVRRDVLESR